MVDSCSGELSLEVEYEAFEEAIQRRDFECRFCYSQYNQNRCWMPCIETLDAPCTWELHLSTALHPDLIIENNSFSFFVVASGELKSQVVEKALNRKVYHYELSVPTVASHVLWASGYFEVSPIAVAGEGFAFCPPGKLGICRFSVDFFPKVPYPLLHGQYSATKRRFMTTP